jgi:predicted RNase H-like nuclease (RuvC/YqgF family)
MCGTPGVCDCACQQSPLCGCAKCVQAIRAEMTRLRGENCELTETLQAIRAEVTGLRGENRELHKQAETKEIENAALKAALAEASTRLQALFQAWLSAANSSDEHRLDWFHCCRGHFAILTVELQCDTK